MLSIIARSRPLAALSVALLALFAVAAAEQPQTPATNHAPAGDPMLGAVGWSWLSDSLSNRNLGWTAEAGTVTRVVSESFAGLADREASVEMEIRASWTPVGGDVADHLRAWADMLCTIAGIPPLPDGVVPLPGQRR